MVTDVSRRSLLQGAVALGELRLGGLAHAEGGAQAAVAVGQDSQASGSMLPYIGTPTSRVDGRAKVTGAAKYAAEFNEVKALGAQSGSSRTAAQTLMAGFYTANPFVFYNTGLRQISTAKGLSTTQEALLFAKTSMASADALIDCFNNKAFHTAWRPQTAIRVDQVGSSGAFGAVPLFTGTLLISGLAMLVAVPVGLMSAIYLAEYATPRFRRYAKPMLEILAGIPTVVYGYFAALTVGPILRQFGESIGLDVASESALGAGLVMGIMIIPFVSSLSDDVMNAVPQSLRDGSYALGATKSETIRQVVVPAALPGIVGAVLLAVVVVKLFIIDLSRISGIERIVSFLGVGVLLLVIGYFAPVPPPRKEGELQ